MATMSPDLLLLRELGGTLTPAQGWLLVQIKAYGGEGVPSIKELARLSQLQPYEVLTALGALSRMGLLHGTVLAVS